MVVHELNWAKRALDAGRLTIPSHFASGISWLAGESETSGWLLAIESERHILLSDKEGEQSSIVRLLSQAKAMDNLRATDPAEHQPPALTVAGSRLVKVALHPPPPGWRVGLSAVPATQTFDTTSGPVMLLLAAGHLEIWSPRLFQEARDVPLAKLLELI
jgi:hypothetical protein